MKSLCASDVPVGEAGCSGLHSQDARRYTVPAGDPTPPQWNWIKPNQTGSDRIKLDQTKAAPKNEANWPAAAGSAFVSRMGKIAIYAPILVQPRVERLFRKCHTRRVLDMVESIRVMKI
jgi:hypothetical protein